MFERMVQDLGAVLLASLRLVPVFGFSPPFTLVKLPATVRVVLVLALANAMVGGGPAAHALRDTGYVLAAFGEMTMGIAMALALQLAFAAIAMAGRALDIQAGFGLAFIIDPTTKAQTPLVGAVFTYAAAAVFFATEAPHDLLAVLAASFDRVPLGTALAPHDLAPLLGFLGTVSIVAFGLVGLAVLTLFLIDLAIAMLSRTLPQMNVLVLGFQVKAMATLLLLPATLALAGAGIVRIIRLALEAMLAMA
jgi:flagellar biosynthetic protein FliR